MYKNGCVLTVGIGACWKINKSDLGPDLCQISQQKETVEDIDDILSVVKVNSNLIGNLTVKFYSTGPRSNFTNLAEGVK